MQDQVDRLVFGQVVHVDDQVVIAGVVPAGTGVALYVILTPSVNFINHLRGFFLRKQLLGHDTVKAMRVRCGEEDIHLVGFVFQRKETGTAGNDAGALRGNSLQDFRLGLEHIVRGNIGPELLDRGFVLFQPGGLLGYRCHHLEEFREPGLLFSLELFNAHSRQLEFVPEFGNEFLVAVTDTQRFGQFAADGTASGAQLAADGNN